MIKYLVFLLLPFASYSQTYVSFSPSIYNGTGSFREKSMFTLEAGRAFDVFNLGVAYGKTNIAPQEAGDTTNFLEIRPTLNVFSSGKFSAGITLGLGHVLNAKQGLMTEFAYGINYMANQHFFFSLFQGFYHFDGRQSASRYSFFGATVGYAFSKKENKALINK
jgi:hypothetical protein